VVFSGTLPKFSGAGAIDNCPAAVPVPVKGTACADPEMNMLPPSVPADCGANLTFSVTLCPPFKVRGNEAPLNENPLPYTVAFVNVIFQVLGLVNTRGMVAVDPAATWPNDIAAGVMVRDSLVTPFPLRSMTSVAFDAVLDNLMLPLVHPVSLGV